MKFTDVSPKLPQRTKHSFIHFWCDQQEQLLTLILNFNAVLQTCLRSTGKKSKCLYFPGVFLCSRWKMCFFCLSCSGVMSWARRVRWRFLFLFMAANTSTSSLSLFRSLFRPTLQVLHARHGHFYIADKDPNASVCLFFLLTLMALTLLFFYHTFEDTTSNSWSIRSHYLPLK